LLLKTRKVVAYDTYVLTTKRYRDSPTGGFPGGHIFGRVCIDNGIEHRLTKPYHP